MRLAALVAAVDRLWRSLAPATALALLATRRQQEGGAQRQQRRRPLLSLQRVTASVLFEHEVSVGAGGAEEAAAHACGMSERGRAVGGLRPAMCL